MSPVSEALPLASFVLISNVAPPIPNTRPSIFKIVIFSFNAQNANIVIKSGVHSISNEACMVEVIVNPLIKSIWLMATPVSPHNINLPRCSFRIDAFVLLKLHSVQNNATLTPTRIRFNPYGPITEGEMNFTRL